LGEPDGAMPETSFLTVESPIGPLTLTARADALAALDWADPGETPIEPISPLLTEAARQIAAYFAGRARSFDLPLAPQGTPFHARVWHAIAEIPFGAHETYGALAARLGTGARAVGRAAGANPLPIIVPCHRVLGAGARLHGYSGRGGIAAKAALLRLEGNSPSG